MGLTDSSLIAPPFFSPPYRLNLAITISAQIKKKKKGNKKEKKGHLAVSYISLIFKISFLFLCDFRFGLQHLILVALPLISKVLVPGLQCHSTSCHSSTTNLEEVYIRK